MRAIWEGNPIGLLKERKPEKQDHEQIQQRTKGMREHIHTKQKGRRCVIFSALGLRKVPRGLKEKKKKKKGSEAPLHWIEVEDTKQRDD